MAAQKELLKITLQSMDIYKEMNIFFLINKFSTCIFSQKNYYNSLIKIYVISII